jgi:predicted DNA-binding transcriptional regulator AlpA
MLTIYNDKAKLLATQLAQFNSLPECALIGIPLLGALLRRSRASIYRDLKVGRLPAPVKFGDSTRWRAGEIRKLLADI